MSKFDLTQTRDFNVMENKRNLTKEEQDRIFRKVLRPIIRVNRRGLITLLWVSIVMLLSINLYPDPMPEGLRGDQFRLSYYFNITMLNIAWAIGILKFEFYDTFEVGPIKFVSFWITYLFFLIMIILEPHLHILTSKEYLFNLVVFEVPVFFIILVTLGRIIFTETRLHD